MSAQVQSNGKGFIRVCILLFVVVNTVTVKKKRCVLGNVHPIVHKTLSRIVGLSHPKRRPRALHLRNFETCRLMYSPTTHLFDDGSNIWKALFVFG
jgi:hypothetical protein